ncbi:STAS domain-containing protein [Microcella daejeonensis]|uniref:Anti-sigma factor antagonist n=1 Tax=Microcella daejeonensis TaxID=2994971 RepID=A0A9E8MIR3_9MICO|nr:STAS domain-containing protein [Microcella daejeonensis]WAB80308.1 STAS domain-containing protein [Microcella daejeonensis]WAB84894.1 STAS domain-containing protein [Microcella daejeonensis]
MNQSTELRPDGVAVMTLDGRLNMVTAAAFREEVSALVGDGHARIAVDLARVEFMDSSGLGALVGGLKSTRQAGGDLRIVAPTEQVLMVMRLTNLERVLAPASSVDEAFPRG